MKNCQGHDAPWVDTIKHSIGELWNRRHAYLTITDSEELRELLDLAEGSIDRGQELLSPAAATLFVSSIGTSQVPSNSSTVNDW